MNDEIEVTDLCPDHASALEYEPFRPILDRVLIRRVEAVATPDGFAIPEKYRQHTNRGVVIAVGDGVVLGTQWRPMKHYLSVGDIVLFGEYTAEKFVQGNEELYIVRLQDVRGVERKKRNDSDRA